MATKHPLKDWAVVVTRPAHQAQPICEQIQQQGGQAVAIPAIEIAPPSDLNHFNDCLQRHSQYDLSIFISQNAARLVFERMAILGLQWQGKVAAVGAATAKSLLVTNEKVIVSNNGDYRSEGLLRELTQFELNRMKIVIYRAQQGREWLKQQLESLGATVAYVEAYQRFPVIETASLNSLKANKQWVSLCSSAEVAQCFLNRLDSTALEIITHSPMVVPSKRVKQRIGGLVKNVIVAKSTLDADMLAAIPLNLG